MLVTFRCGLAHTAHKQDGTLKERPPLSGVLALWRPAFLNLPDELGRESMGRHILLSIPVGLAAGALLSAASSAISYFFVLG